MSIGKVTAESALEPTAPAGSAPSAHRAPLLFVLAVSALLFGFVSGLRWPSNWATTHYLFDYSNGFIKRGFTGEVLSYVAGDSLSYGAIAALSFAIFAIWLSMLFLRLRGLAKIDNRIWIITAVVLISPGFVFQVRNIGYLDHIGLIIVFLCFFLPANLSGLVARTGLCGLMIIIHEAFFLMFFPLVILEFTIRAMLTGGRGRIAATWIAVAVLAALTFVVAQTTLP
ncbi:MAG: hypothetical protein HKN28_07450, partial [Alphaproteobacteria bacterium]|nr:hypothetical protein [Alphaproteobacteria bacterium]